MPRSTPARLSDLEWYPREHTHYFDHAHVQLPNGNWLWLETCVRDVDEVRYHVYLHREPPKLSDSGLGTGLMWGSNYSSSIITSHGSLDAVEAQCLLNAYLGCNDAD